MISQYCPHLTSVDFGFCDVTIEMLDYLVTGCKSLHTVNFEGCECVNREWVEKLCQLKVSSISDSQVALACQPESNLYPIRDPNQIIESQSLKSNGSAMAS